MAVAEQDQLFEELPEQIAPVPGGSGRPRLRKAERGQVELRALSLDDLVPADHRVRLVWAFAEKLDLAPLYAAIKAVEGRPGHPPAEAMSNEARGHGVEYLAQGEAAGGGDPDAKTPRSP